MKIIGSTTHHSLLVEMTRDEFARIGGFSDDYDLAKNDLGHRADREHSFRVGRQLEVSKIYSRLIDQQRNAERLNEAAKTLRAIADLTECVMPVLEEMKDGGAK